MLSLHCSHVHVSIYNYLYVFSASSNDETDEPVSMMVIVLAAVGGLIFTILIIGMSILIMLTCPCNVDPLTPNFYIVKLGFTGVNIIFLFCS